MAFADPYDYATYDDAVSNLPNLATVTGGEAIYNVFRDFMPALIDKGRYQIYTGMLSFNLTMYFFVQFVEGSTNEKFYADDYFSTSGSISATLANGVSTSFAQSKVQGNWESTLTQNDFGNTYLILAKATNLAIGIDGQGNPWAAL